MNSSKTSALELTRIFLNTP